MHVYDKNHYIFCLQIKTVVKNNLYRASERKARKPNALHFNAEVIN